jgi:hypothetical protein
MDIIFKTNIDKFKGKFPNNFTKVPTNGDFIKINNYYLKHNLPFDELQVKKITWLDSQNVEVELHLSDIQERENQTFDLGVYK